ncbi:N-acetyl-D-Glu racemase DgcA [Coralliovum pocilloporae]|uniref:N-acetyl-D-Glu racemase DgcA n=1 Tax=Coralliovum pocilloporae TaxID=3066369 RepID=UPI003306B362
MSERTLSHSIDRFPIAGSFTISRGSRTEIVVVSVTISEGGLQGRGECVPYARYGESTDSVIDQINAVTEALCAGMSRQELQSAMPAGAARNAVDCALWDLECKSSGRTAAEIAGLPRLTSGTTAYTLSLGTPDSMFDAARTNAHRPLLKVKLGGDGDADRIRAVRDGAPDSRIIVDANESWRADIYEINMDACAKAGVVLVEQPLPASDDSVLSELPRPITVCADESLHTRADLPRLRPLYDAINIKLDKAGGLTEALLLQQDARAQGFKIMIGCMLGTSLAMAPAMLIAQDADVIDLDGPLLLAQDRDNALAYEDGLIMPPTPALWG